MESIDSIPTLGLKENRYQFTLLVIVNAFVGAMIGLERTLLPQIAEKEFCLAINTAILSFIVVFGFTKGITNYFAGSWSDHFGRKIFSFWMDCRDSGYAIGEIVSGVVADVFGIHVANGLIAFITFGSGTVVASRMKETLKKSDKF